MFWYPHIKGGGAGSENFFSDSWSAANAYCQKCAGAYRLLDLSYGASKERVKAKKWAFAELFSADRLRTMSEQARRLAEEQHKSINAACDQILRCPDCARLRDNRGGSESRPATEQPKSAMTAQEESEPRPDIHPPADQALAILKETNNEINASTVVKEPTGRRFEEAEDSIGSSAPEWHPAPEQAPASMTAQEESQPQGDEYFQADEVLVMLKGTNDGIGTSRFAGEQEKFVDSIPHEWHPAAEQPLSAAVAQEAFDETLPGNFSARTVVLVIVLIVSTLVGWSLNSRQKAQMAIEDRQHLYIEQQHQQEAQIERVKEEQQRQQQEACAERSLASRGRLAHKALRVRQVVWQTSR